MCEYVCSLCCIAFVLFLSLSRLPSLFALHLYVAVRLLLMHSAVLVDDSHRNLRI
jgi:hypothetical protein